jgi:hypothetical protein
VETEEVRIKGRGYGERPLIMYITLLHLDEGKWTWGKDRRLLAIPDEHLAQSPVRRSVLKLLSIGQLEGG